MAKCSRLLCCSSCPTQVFQLGGVLVFRSKAPVSSKQINSTMQPEQISFFSLFFPLFFFSLFPPALSRSLRLWHMGGCQNWDAFRGRRSSRRSQPQMLKEKRSDPLLRAYGPGGRVGMKVTLASMKQGQCRHHAMRK